MPTSSPPRTAPPPSYSPPSATPRRRSRSNRHRRVRHTGMTASSDTVSEVTRMGEQAPRGTLYVVVCAAPPAAHVQDLVKLAQAAGWEVAVTATPFAPPPTVTPPLARHPTFRTSLRQLRKWGVRVLFEESAPREARMPPWEEILEEVNQAHE